MKIAILDCYTDEPSGLGVPPYLGTYPRYIAGMAIASGAECAYLRIDDLRQPRKLKHTTDILTINQTLNTPRVLEKAKLILVIAGIHTPGKYLRAVPATLKEAARLLRPFKPKKLLCGPAIMGSMQTGGRYAKNETMLLDGVASMEEVEALLTHSKPRNLDYKAMQRYALAGATILQQIPQPTIAELETGKGCPREEGCSFCTEPLKHKLEWRNQALIIEEVKALMKAGCEHFRLGKQSDFYSYKGGEPKQIQQLLAPLSRLKPKTLHIDNVDPVSAASGEEITKLIVKYCTPGNVAAMGVESFDPAVIKANRLAAKPELVLKAVASINRHGAARGTNGMPCFLPGLNLILGLIGETSKTLQLNLEWLQRMLREGLLLRRINIRQVDIFPGTMMAQYGLKSLKRNKRHYFSFRKKVRESVDHEMLKRIAPEGSVLKEVLMETHEGSHTFGRQLGSYPLIVGTNSKLKLGEFYNVRVIGHMLRSVIGEPI